MRQKRLTRIRDKVVAKVRCRFERVHPHPTKGVFNFRCFENAVQHASEYKVQENVEVWECMIVDGGDPALHYICKDVGTGYFLEVTIGWRADYVEYYPIRKVSPADWKAIGSVFNDSLGYWHREYTNWFDRAVLRIDRVC
jgi:hypothetical protein